MNIIKFTTGLFLMLLSTIAQSQSEWTWRNPLPQGNTLTSIAWTGEKAVAVGHEGTVIISNDGISWEIVNTGGFEALMSVIWTGKGFIAAGNKGKILTSTDGKSWSKTPEFTDNNIKELIMGPDRCIAIGDSGVIYTSTDFKTWNVTFSNKDIGLEAGVWGGGQFLAVGKSKTVVTSPDGIHWTVQQQNSSGLYCDVTWTGEHYVAVGNWSERYSVMDDNEIAISKDGTVWTPVEINNGSEIAIIGPNKTVIWTGDSCFAIGSNKELYTSSDGLKWQKVANSVYEFLDMVWTGEKCILVGIDGVLGTYPGLFGRFEYHTRGISENFRTVMWSGKKFMAFGYYGSLVTSPDGIEWAYEKSQKPIVFALARNDTRIVGVGSGSSTYAGVKWSDDDGDTWQSKDSLPFSPFKDIFWTGKRFVAANYSSVGFSTDGQDWEIVKLDEKWACHHIAGNETFLVIVGTVYIDANYTKTIKVSKDGRIWTECPVQVDFAFSDVAYGGGTLVVAALDTSKVLVTSNGIQWDICETGAKNGFNKIRWIEGQFFGLRYAQPVMTSRDGKTWKTFDSLKTVSFADIAINNKIIVAVGSSGGRILTAPVHNSSRVQRYSKRSASQELTVYYYNNVMYSSNYRAGNEPEKIDLYDFSGKRIPVDYTYVKDKLIIQMNKKLQCGIYICKVHHSDGQSVFKINHFFAN